MKSFSCDFETTTEPFYNKYGYTRVWGACAVNIDDTSEIKIFNNIEDFINYFVENTANLYFHNLSFDGSYILDYLLNNGWTYDDELKTHKTFRVVISDMGTWYMIELCKRAYSSKKIKTTIYDSLKKLPFKVSDISKAFKLEESKLVIDYDKERPDGYVMTEEEKEYLVTDCMIVAKALKIQFSQGLTKMTIGSDALNYYKSEIGVKVFKSVFPVLTLEVDDYIRKSYKGGWTYVNPRYANYVFKGVSYDVNSLYPSCMYGNNGLLPFGVPIYYEGRYEYDEMYPLYICRILVAFTIKEKHFPSIQIKQYVNFLDTEYLTDSDGVVELTLTSVDLQLLFQNYNIDFIRYLDGYKFMGASDMFKPYIDYWSNIKANSSGAIRQLAKLMLNNLYGKFAKNPKMAHRVPKLENGIVEFDIVEDDYSDSVYTAVGSFITSYARKQTIETANSLYDRFVYADTDSVHLIGTDDPENIKIDDNKLGYWKNEGIFESAKFVKAKTYIKYKNGKIDLTCAGMSDSIKERVSNMDKEKVFDLFTTGGTFDGKLLPKRVKGGVILTNTTFTIK